MNYALVVLQQKARFSAHPFTYVIPPDLEDRALPGVRVRVPFGKGNRQALGLILALTDQKGDYAVKSIAHVLDSDPLLTQEALGMMEFMMDQNLADASSALGPLLPPGAISEILTTYQALEGEGDLEHFLDRPKDYEAIKAAFGSRYSLSHIHALVEAGQLERIFSYKRQASIKMVEYAECMVPAFESKRAPAQVRLVRCLKEGGRMEVKDLLVQAKTTRQTLNRLVDMGVVKLSHERSFRAVLPDQIQGYAKHRLNSEQEAAFNAVISRENLRFLLQGVTGSGKTELYLQLAERVLAQGKSVITLVPEIALTPQTIARFSGRFGKKIAILHSRLSVSERFDEWTRIRSGQARIVVGARSAIFAPLTNLGLIVIDEAHEKTYISEQSPYYNAIKIAEFRSDYNHCPLVLGTATPDVRVRHLVEGKGYSHLVLENRAAASALPQVEIVDMRAELKADNFSMLSRSLQDKVQTALDRGEQSLLFLNKRGHTSYVFCRTCGYIWKCEACDVSMTYHKRENRLICHYCGRTAPKPHQCPSCRSTKGVREFGAGTEKLEEEVRRLFPKARVLRADADTTKHKDDYAKLDRIMRSGEADILVGTQMIAKGLDFPKLTVVGVVAADLSLNAPDYTAQERTFQLITQVSGRAGRADLPGQVVIQTYNPGHYAIQTAALADYEAFYAEEIRVREAFSYPPFTEIALIRLEHERKQVCKEASFEIIEEIKGHMSQTMRDQTSIQGPNPAVIQRINNVYRYNIIIKTGDKMEDFRAFLRHISQKTYPNGVRVRVVIDPVSLF